MSLLSYDTSAQETWAHESIRLEVLARKTMLPEVTCMHLETCLNCLASKQHRVSFQHIRPERKSHPFELGILICIIRKDRTLGVALYFTRSIYNLWRKLWCFKLNSKDQVLEIFKCFHVSVEQETRS